MQENCYTLLSVSSAPTHRDRLLWPCLCAWVLSAQLQRVGKGRIPTQAEHSKSPPRNMKLWPVSAGFLKDMQTRGLGMTICFRVPKEAKEMVRRERRMEKKHTEKEKNRLVTPQRAEWWDQMREWLSWILMAFQFLVLLSSETRLHFLIRVREGWLRAVTDSKVCTGPDTVEICFSSHKQIQMVLSCQGWQ